MRIAELKPGNGQGFAEWEAGRTEEWLVSGEGIYFTGLTYLRIEDYEKALFHFEEAVKKIPKHVEAYFQIGYCNGNLGRYQEAIDASKQAIRIKPDDAEAHYNLGVFYLIFGDRSSALDQYKVLKELDKDLANELFNLIYE